MNRSNTTRLVIVIGMLVGISALHYLTTTQYHQAHDIYRRLYYVPIVLGGLWFGLRGGIGSAVATSIIYMPHVVFQWGHHPSVELEQYLEIVLYNVIGFLTGFLAQRESEQKRRYQRTAENLEQSYRTLREQADQIIEIEEQLRRADRLSALGELSAGMAHEIRNPLGSIRGTAEILREEVPEDDPKAEFTSILIKEVDRLNRVLEDFLSFAKPGPEEHECFDLNQTVQEVLHLTRQQALKNRVEVSFEKNELPEFSGDCEHLKQAFLNIVLNALQVMTGGGTLKVATAFDQKTILISFVDDGPGIAADERERIFNPFVTSRSDGTGLGLAITQRIVHSHGGQIKLESEPGEGATFTVCLPVQ